MQNIQDERLCEEKFKEETGEDATYRCEDDWNPGRYNTKTRDSYVVWLEKLAAQTIRSVSPNANDVMVPKFDKDISEIAPHAAPEWVEDTMAQLGERQAEINRLRAENERLEMLLQMAYCQKIGADAPHGLGCCDNYRDWLSSLSPNA